MSTLTNPDQVRRTVRRGGLIRFDNRDFHAATLARHEGAQVLVRLGDDGEGALEILHEGRVVCRAGERPPEQPGDPTGVGGLVNVPAGRASGCVAEPFDAPPLEEPEPAHYHQLVRASVILTENLLLARCAIADVIDEYAIAVVYGEPGLGKTFALEWALRGLHHTTVVFPSRPSPRENVARLYEDITGRPAVGSRYKVEGALREGLRRPHIIAVDEAEKLTGECLDQLRQLHDYRDTRFSLIFVGSPECGRVIDADDRLESRIYHRVEFLPLSDATILAVIPGYHPLYAEAPRELLLRVNDDYAHGNLRRWAKFTHKAARLCAERRIALDDDVVDAILATS